MVAWASETLPTGPCVTPSACLNFMQCMRLPCAGRYHAANIALPITIFPPCPGRPCIHSTGPSAQRLPSLWFCWTPHRTDLAKPCSLPGRLGWAGFLGVGLDRSGQRSLCDTSLPAT
eukprot:350388-Chlamydomonas_euryale.AAC.23